MADTIRVLVVDDHAVVRRGLVNTLGVEPDMRIIGEAEDGLDAVSRAVELSPDVILMDLFMPRCGGLVALAAIRERLPAARVLVLTISEDENDVFQALALGANGYLLKTSPLSEIVRAVRMTAAAESALSPTVVSRLVSAFRERNAEPRLSSREREVLSLLGQGCTNTEIAGHLLIGEATVRTYLHRIMEKLHLTNRLQTVAYAARFSPATATHSSRLLNMLGGDMHSG